ncbi:hypothetical protein GCM10011487_61850 [Steroidobacter agaridevorans]|uniref:Uncharacterized protein n=1 Tax=Steroidobacter agaridevorans TaxID=2695856 RepID=A0A829YLK5_9GAMM|nr:hypothetical protein [Steroidobacter agaridevorans]GFE84185.1 hypothetical protein GCM10011487_61850 [Steroidobacter agaridevorans]GFE87008.1 hypothetical protein GCM10011488_19620 [Steroidobacter agaridevorans]
MCELAEHTCKNKRGAITRAQAEAKKRLLKANGKVENYRAAVSRSEKLQGQNKAVGDVLRRCFGWRGDEYQKELAGTYTDTPRNLHRAIRTLLEHVDAPIHAACGGEIAHAALNPRFKDEISFVMAMSHESNQNCFSFTDRFFGATLEKQAKTILHEMCHAWLYMSDVAYEGLGGWNSLNKHNSEHNPDSYAVAIRDLGK